MTLVQKEIEHDTYKVEIKVDDIKVQRSEIELNLGYSENTIPLYFSDMIDDVLSKLPGLCEIQAGYRVVNVVKPTGRNDGLNVNGIFFNLNKIVTGQLKKSTQAALFLCTIGDKMEKWSKELLKEGDPTKSYIVDAVASATVENVTDVLHDYIGKKMSEKGLNVTNRYSPGYCLWSVSEQHLLFSLLPENFCGVKLNESALMHPIKSVSGIIGIGKEVKWREYMCDRCGVKDCTYRQKRMEKIR